MTNNDQLEDLISVGLGKLRNNEFAGASNAFKRCSELLLKMHAKSINDLVTKDSLIKELEYRQE